MVYTGNTISTTNGSIISYVGELVSGALSAAASAQIDVYSTTRGGRPVPSVTTAQKNAIVAPATGLMVFDVTLNAYQWYNGAAWTAFGSAYVHPDPIDLVNGYKVSGTTIINSAGHVLPVAIDYTNVPANVGILGVIATTTKVLWGTLDSGDNFSFVRIGSGSCNFNIKYNGTVLAGLRSNGGNNGLLVLNNTDIIGNGGIPYFNVSITSLAGVLLDGLDLSEYITAWKMVAATPPARKQNVKTSYMRATVGVGGNVTINLDDAGTGLGNAVYAVKPCIVANYEDKAAAGVLPLDVDIAADKKTAIVYGDVSAAVMIIIVGEVA